MYCKYFISQNMFSRLGPIEGVCVLHLCMQLCTLQTDPLCVELVLVIYPHAVYSCIDTQCSSYACFFKPHILLDDDLIQTVFWVNVGMQ